MVQWEAFIYVLFVEMFSVHVVGGEGDGPWGRKQLEDIDTIYPLVVACGPLNHHKAISSLTLQPLQPSALNKTLNIVFSHDQHARLSCRARLRPKTWHIKKPLALPMRTKSLGPWKVSRVCKLGSPKVVQTK